MPVLNIPRSTPEVIRAFREAKQLSLKEFAEFVKLPNQPAPSRELIHKWENGICEPSREYMAEWYTSLNPELKELAQEVFAARARVPMTLLNEFAAAQAA